MKRIFLSYSIQDQHFASLLRAQLANESSLQILTNELVEASNVGTIKKVISARMSEASIIVTFITFSEISRWVDWELQHAAQLQKPILGVVIDKSIKEIPNLHKKLNIPVVYWQFDDLITALRQTGHSLDYKANDNVDKNQIIRVDFGEVTKQLTEELIRNPGDIHRLTPREFEELIAYLLEKLGYEVDLTKQTRDGGVDIFAVRKEAIGEFLTIVDCKKYSVNRPIGIELVRGLYGTLNIEKASHAMIATTSRFTSDAKQFEAQHRFQVSLKDHSDILNWMKK